MFIDYLIFNIISSENEKTTIFIFLQYAKIRKVLNGRILNVSTLVLPDLSNGGYFNRIDKSISNDHRNINMGSEKNSDIFHCKVVEGEL